MEDANSSSPMIEVDKMDRMRADDEWRQAMWGGIGFRPTKSLRGGRTALAPKLADMICAQNFFKSNMFWLLENSKVAEFQSKT